MASVNFRRYLYPFAELFSQLITELWYHVLSNFHSVCSYYDETMKCQNLGRDRDLIFDLKRTLVDTLRSWNFLWGFNLFDQNRTKCFSKNGFHRTFWSHHILPIKTEQVRSSRLKHCITSISILLYLLWFPSNLNNKGQGHQWPLPLKPFSR